jgi:hypothetical protein
MLLFPVGTHTLGHLRVLEITYILNVIDCICIAGIQENK